MGNDLELTGGNTANVKLCECGCGNPTTIATVNDSRNGRVKGEASRFIRGHQMKGTNHYRWNGGRTIHRSGYIMVRCPGHPRARKDHYVFEHILIVEQAIGRHLEEPHEVHHFNEVRGDNSNGNLVACENRAYHQLLHVRATAYKATGNADSRKCTYCQEWGLDLIVHKNKNPYHRACRMQDRAKRKLAKLHQS